MTFDKLTVESPKLLYQQLADIIVTKITGKEISVGNRIPPERELCKTFGVSLDTVRDALSTLVKEGYIARKRKLGTFVISSKPRSIDFEVKNKIELLNFLPPKETLSPDSALSSIYNFKVLRGIEEKVAEKGIHLIYKFINDEELDLQDIEKEIAGIIVIGDITPERFRRVQRVKIPFVLVGDVEKRELTNGGVDIVSTDDFHRVYRATRYLIDAGHKRIVYMCRSSYSWDLEKNKGYEQALKDANIAFDNGLLVELVRFDGDEGYEATKKLLEKGVPFTGIVTSVGDADHSTGIIKALSEKKLGVPEDVSIVACNKFLASITTVSYDIEELGRTAVDLLLEKLKSPEGWKSKRVIISSKLRKGGSVRKINNGL